MSKGDEASRHRDVAAVKEMRCAGCDWVPRQFHMIGTDDEYEGEPDYGCSDCGWMQRTEAGAAAELCRLATWHNLASYGEHRDIARAGGHDVPDAPHHLALASTQE